MRVAESSELRAALLPHETCVTASLTIREGRLRSTADLGNRAHSGPKKAPLARKCTPLAARSIEKQAVGVSAAS